jgi:excisionase family DNA binding protein
MNRTLARALLLALVAAAAPAQPALPAASQPVTEREVLDAEEAAALLRVSPETILRLAEAGRIPARRVGDVWRFWRAALLEWLVGGDAAPVRTSEAAVLNGRGPLPLSQANPSPAAPAGPPLAGTPPTVGERPASPTTGEIALLEQGVLLRRGFGTVDFSASYGRSEQTLLPVVRVEDRTLAPTATLRYGVLDNLQVTLRAPGVWRRTATFSDASVSGTTTPRVSREAFSGGAAVSLLGVLSAEAEGRPTVLWSLDGVIPTGTRDRGFGGGIVLAKSYDPAVLFAGVSYLRGLSVSPSDSRLSLAQHNYGAQLGYTYAVNDTLALSTALIGSYRSSRSPDGVSIPPPREHYALQLGATWQILPGVFLEPAAAVRVGGDTPGLTLSLNFSRSFEWRKRP